jgi:hypothetical protein
VADVNKILQYGITFFVTTGTIRVQGSKYKHFAEKEFPMWALSSYRIKSIASNGQFLAFPVRLLRFVGKQDTGYSSLMFFMSVSFSTELPFWILLFKKTKR